MPDPTPSPGILHLPNLLPADFGIQILALICIAFFFALAISAAVYFFGTLTRRILDRILDRIIPPRH